MSHTNKLFILLTDLRVISFGIPFVFVVQFIDINLQQKNLVGIQFVIWSAGSWINNKGTNFFVGLNPSSPTGKVSFPSTCYIFYLSLFSVIVYLILSKVKR